MFFTRNNFYIFAIMVGVIVGITAITSTAHAASFVVDSNLDTIDINNGDANNGDGICDDGYGNCTLRAAIIEANTTVELDTITFSGPMVISLGSVLPAVTAPLEINAESGSGGTTCGANGVVDTVIGVRIENYGLQLETGSEGSLIRGLNISNLTNTNAISVQNTNTIAIECNFLGTTQSGMETQGFDQAGKGISISNASFITIGGSTLGDGNLISGFVSSDVLNEFPGAAAIQDTDNVVMMGNFVGTDKLGTSPLGNNFGVGISGGSGITIGGNRLLNPAVRNIFAGNILNQANGAGVKIYNTDNIVVSGNYFGLGADGITAITNGGVGNTGGLDICNVSDCGGNDTATEGVQIGGPTLGEGNIFAAETLSEPLEFNNFSMATSGSFSEGLIQGNWFGLTASGGAHAGISFDVVRIGAVDGSLIMGGTDDEVNIFGKMNPDPYFSALSYYALDTDTTIEGNYFGFEADKETTIENSMNRAIQVVAPTAEETIILQDNVISNTNTGVHVFLFDGTQAGQISLLNNDISDADTGIAVFTTYFFEELQNTEFSPVTLLQNTFTRVTIPIDLAEDRDIDGDLTPEVSLGPTPNDPSDTDTGPNDYLNTPIIHSVDITGLTTYSVDVPPGTYRIEFFAGSGVNQATDYVGYDTFISTGSSKQQTVTLDLSGLDNDDHISATTTQDLGNDEYGATSELSQAYVPLVTAKKKSGSVPTQSPVRVVSSSTSSPSSTGTCPTDQILTQNMRAGARNGRFHPYTKAIVTEVKILQAHMNRLGFNSGPVDGILGPITDGAIKRMQTFLGTKADGMIGPITRGLINNSCGSEGLKKTL